MGYQCSNGTAPSAEALGTSGNPPAVFVEAAAMFSKDGTFRSNASGLTTSSIMVVHPITLQKGQTLEPVPEKLIDFSDKDTLQLFKKKANSSRSSRIRRSSSPSAPAGWSRMRKADRIDVLSERHEVRYGLQCRQFLAPPSLYQRPGAASRDSYFDITDLVIHGTE